jgi:two-component system, sensor histidine kinase
LLVINAVVAAAMIYGLWRVEPSRGLLVWAGAAAATLALRAAYYLAYRRRALEPARAVWSRGAVICSAASGALWGAAGLFLFPSGLLQYQLFILFILMGMGAGAVSSLTAYMPAFYAFVPAALLPIGARLMPINDPIHIALGVMTFAYVGGLSFFARTINRTITESLSLRFENIDLVRELSEQRDEAERANVGKSKFLAAASHDLRQPLHALTLFTSALDERIRYPEVRRIVDNINASVRALEKLFNALLDISRLDAGVLQPEIRHFRVEDVLRRLVNDHAPDAAAKNLALVCAPTAAVVRSDPALLERILRNYISNAIRYTDRGEVHVACTPLNDAVRIEVSDTGIGIPEVHQRDIFNEFYQLGNPERDRTKGLGLGLAIVDRVARLLEHPISVASAPGRGACFAVVVPLGDAGQIVCEPASDGAGANHDLSGLRVVVVDDEIGVREGMRTLLAQWGCDVVVAGSEDEAVAAVLAAGWLPEVAIVDYRLRDERTGVQAVERLRREFGDAIPALIVTGDTAPERIREAQASNYPLVHKPVSPAVLRASLRRVRNRTLAATS